MSAEVESSKRKPRRRWLRYSLRTLLVVVTVGCVALGVWVNRAERQRRAVAAIRAAGGDVGYDFEESGAEAPSPPWLSKLVGVDYLADPVGAWFKKSSTDVDMVHLSELTSLEYVDLAGTKVSDAGLAHLSELKNLESLNLDDAQVSGAGLAHLSGLTSLRFLYLADTQVSDAGLAHLSGLTRLQVLDLGGTQVSDAGYEQFRKSLPDCQIYR